MAYQELFNLAWPDQDIFEGVFDAALPGGFFVVEHLASGLLVSACNAARPGTFPEYPLAGSLGYLVTDPDHGGRGLATTVVLAVMNRLMAEEFKAVFLNTEDERLAAIRIYLKLGWEPLVYAEGMEERWQAILSALGS